MLLQLLYVVGIGFGQDDNEVNEPANTEKAASEQPQDTSADFTLVKTVSADPTQEQTQEKGDPLAFLVASVPVYIGVGISDNDIRLLGFEFSNLFSAVGADNAILVDDLAAVLAELGSLFSGLARRIAVHTDLGGCGDLTAAVLTKLIIHLDLSFLRTTHVLLQPSYATFWSKATKI